MYRLLAAVTLIFLGVLPGFAQQPATEMAEPHSEFPELPPAKTVRVNGVELAYVKMGRGEPVIFIHGFLHDYRSWSLQVPEFSKKFRAISLSLRYRWPGAEPPEDTDLSPAANRADLVAFIRERKLGPVHLVGHSGGANIALRVAREHPELVRSLILGEPGPFAVATERRPEQPPMSPERLTRLREAYDRGEMETAVGVMAEIVLGPEARERPLRPWVGRILTDNAWQLRLLWSGRGQEPPLSCDEVRQMKTPALLLGGDRSPAMFGSVLDALEECLPVAERATLPESSHGLQLENPAEFNRIVLEFLSRHSQLTKK